MKKAVTLFLVAGAWFGTVQFASAQQPAASPPKVLVIGREVEKPGKRSAHEKWEAGWPAAFAKANWPVHYLAASSMTGENRALFLTGYDSAADWEKDNQATGKNAAFSAELSRLGEKEGDYISESRTGVFRYEPDISYPRTEGSLGERRYFLVISIHVKPGHGDHFTEVRKIAKAAHEKVNAADHFVIFHAVAGSDPGHYVIFIALKSLAEWDQFPEIHGKAYQDALGEEGQKKIQEFNSQGLESSETQLFAFNPRMSYPDDSWVKADPDFWKPKAAPAAKPAAKKEAAKPSAN